MENEIKKQNKIPGSCEQFTKPEEILELQKYLRTVKDDYESTTYLEDKNLEIAGKASIKEIDSLPDYLQVLGTKDDVSELVSKKVWLEADRDIEKLETIKQKLDGVKDVSLSDFKEKLGGSTDIESLVNYKDTLEDRREVNLSDYKERLEAKDIDRLEDYRESLETSDVDKLEDYRESLEVGSTPDLSRYRERLDDTRKGVILEDYKDKLKGDKAIPEKLEKYKDTLEVNDRIDLSEGNIHLSINEDELSLDSKQITLEDTEKKIKLEDSAEKLSIEGGDLTLPKKTEELSVNTKVNLRDEVLKIRDDSDIKLSKTLIENPGKEKNVTLESKPVKLLGEEKVHVLNKSVEVLKGPRDIAELETKKVTTLDKPGVISELRETVVKGPRELIVGLEKKKVNLNVNNQNRLNPDKVKLSGTIQDISLDNYLDTLFIEGDDELNSHREKLKGDINEIEKLEKTVVEGPKLNRGDITLGTGKESLGGVRIETEKLEDIVVKNPGFDMNPELSTERVDLVNFSETPSLPGNETKELLPSLKEVSLSTSQIKRGGETSDPENLRTTNDITINDLEELTSLSDYLELLEGAEEKNKLEDKRIILENAEDKNKLEDKRIILENAEDKNKLEDKRIILENAEDKNKLKVYKEILNVKTEDEELEDKKSLRPGNENSHERLIRLDNWVEEGATYPFVDTLKYEELRRRPENDTTKGDERFKWSEEFDMLVSETSSHDGELPTDPLSEYHKEIRQENKNNSEESKKLDKWIEDQDSNSFINFLEKEELRRRPEDSPKTWVGSDGDIYISKEFDPDEETLYDSVVQRQGDDKTKENYYSIYNEDTKKLEIVKGILHDEIDPDTDLLPQMALDKFEKVLPPQLGSDEKTDQIYKLNLNYLEKAEEEDADLAEIMKDRLLDSTEDKLKKLLGYADRIKKIYNIEWVDKIKTLIDTYLGGGGEISEERAEEFEIQLYKTLLGRVVGRDESKNKGKRFKLSPVDTMTQKEFNDDRFDFVDDRWHRSSRSNTVPMYNGGWAPRFNGVDPGDYLRYVAETTVGLIPKGSGKVVRKTRALLLDETLGLLVAYRREYEKAMKINRDRLPGDMMNTSIEGITNAALDAFTPKAGSQTANMTIPSNRPGTEFYDKSETIKKEVKDKDGNITGTKDISYDIVKEGFTLLSNKGGNIYPDTNRILEGKDDWYKFGYNLMGKNSGSYITFNQYINSLGSGFKTTLDEIIGVEQDSIQSVKELMDSLKNSQFYTSANKVTSTSENITRVRTLDTNIYWEIKFQPYAGIENGFVSYLPLFDVINQENFEQHGYRTSYNYWIPVNSFELGKSKLNSKTLGLFDGEISYPVSLEMTNEFKLTFVDDQYKSWRRYFEKCIDSMIFYSEPTLVPYGSGERTVAAPNGYTAPDKDNIYLAPYKNITFRCIIYSMTPQLSTINKYDLLLVLKDFVEERSGEIDGAAGDLSVTFSIVGENPRSNNNDTMVNAKLIAPDNTNPKNKLKTSETGDIGSIIKRGVNKVIGVFT